MKPLTGHFNGRHIVIDEPAVDLKPGDRVQIVPAGTDAADLADELLRLAVPSEDLPPDFSEQHEHYVKGTPRR